MSSATVVVTARMRALPGKAEEVRSLLTTLAEYTNAEDGPEVYVLQRGIEEPNLFLVYENWPSAEALEAHGRTAHLQDFNRAVEPLLDGDLVVETFRLLD